MKTGDQIAHIVEQISYKDWDIGLYADTNGGFYLQVKFVDECIVSGEKQTQHGRKWRISQYMTETEIVTTALSAVLMAEEHEVRERFSYRGHNVYGPHFSVKDLIYLCETGNLDFRPHPSSTTTGVDVDF